jgi:hypothetical protein
MSFRGAVPILSSVTGRHLVQDNVVSNYFSELFFFLSLIYSYNSPLRRWMPGSMIFLFDL